MGFPKDVFCDCCERDFGSAFVSLSVCERCADRISEMGRKVQVPLAQRRVTLEVQEEIREAVEGGFPHVTPADATGEFDRLTKGWSEEGVRSLAFEMWREVHRLRALLGYPVPSAKG